jgi:UDP-2,3-diacylglucosamine pyrophosphatase LpxH
MLVIISDLHFCDGTASPRNVSPDAFGVLFEDIYELAHDYRAERVDLVFLGDVIDLLRTERWFEVPVESRPWGSGDVLEDSRPSVATLAQARLITSQILDQNAAALAGLRGETGMRPPCEVRRIYLPGNHDRLYLHDDQIRQAVRQALGAVDERTLEAEGITQHRLRMPRYGLLARHGHEWDAWNFERYRDDATAESYRPEDYLLTPIGDPITTELVARLPFELKRRLAETPEFKGTPELAAVYERMQRIEDVRPLTASFRYLFYQAGRLHGELPPSQAEVLSRVLQETARVISADFQSLSYYKRWRDLHHHAWRLDAANRLQLILSLVEHFDVARTIGVIDKYQSLFERVEDDDTCMDGARREDLSALGASGPRFVVYGHTHEPLQAALHADVTRDIYLNSGTWRQRQFLAADNSGFVDWELFTYLVFVDRTETNDGTDRGVPAFINWSGTRRVRAS